MNVNLPQFRKKYIPEICRCAEMERKLRYMEHEMAKDDVFIPTAPSNPPALRPNEMVMYEVSIWRVVMPYVLFSVTGENWFTLFLLDLSGFGGYLFLNGRG